MHRNLLIAFLLFCFNSANAQGSNFRVGQTFTFSIDVWNVEAEKFTIVQQSKGDLLEATVFSGFTADGRKVQIAVSPQVEKIGVLVDLEASNDPDQHKVIFCTLQASIPDTWVGMGVMTPYSLVSSIWISKDLDKENPPCSLKLQQGGNT